MNRVPIFIICVALAATMLFPGVSRLHAQEQTPSPPRGADPFAHAVCTSNPKMRKTRNPFAPEPAPVLQPGMKGRIQTIRAQSLRRACITRAKQPWESSTFSSSKSLRRFNWALIILMTQKCRRCWGSSTSPNVAKMPKPMQLVIAQLAFANSDLAFQGNHLFQGNFYGVNIFDISNPANTKLVTSLVCPGGQGDVSVYKNLLFMSVEQPNGRLDCGTQGFPPDPAPPAGEPKA